MNSSTWSLQTIAHSIDHYKYSTRLSCIFPPPNRTHYNHTPESQYHIASPSFRRRRIHPLSQMHSRVSIWSELLTRSLELVIRLSLWIEEFFDGTWSSFSLSSSYQLSHCYCWMIATVFNCQLQKQSSRLSLTWNRFQASSTWISRNKKSYYWCVSDVCRVQVYSSSSFL